MKYEKISAVMFALWGLLHIAGGSMILLATGESPAKGFAIYQESGAAYTELAGAVLSYLAYGFVWVGAVVAWIGLRHNWRNSHDGLLLNTVLVGLTEIGLVIFLLLPGYVGWGEALPGLLLFTGAILTGGVACRSESKLAPAAVAATARR